MICQSHAKGRTQVRWYQFTLRTLLIGVFALSIVFAWFGVKFREARRQQEAIRKIHSLGWVTLYEDQHPPDYGAEGPVPDWLRRTLGDDLFFVVDDVNASFDYDISETDMAYLRALPSIKYLSLECTDTNEMVLKSLTHFPALTHLDLNSSTVTDAGVVHLRDVPTLEDLDLNDTIIGNSGIEALTGLRNLRRLCLDRTRITEVPSLAGLSHLEGLTLSGTAVGDESLKHIAAATNLTGLGLRDTNITDAGLPHLAGLTQLKFLDLGATRVTDDGLPALSTLRNLRSLYLDGTSVSNQGLEKLKQDLPNLKIVCI